MTREEQVNELVNYEIDRIEARQELKEAHRKQLSDFDKATRRGRTKLKEKYKGLVSTKPELSK